jgi:hypothetical protein
MTEHYWATFGPWHCRRGLARPEMQPTAPRLTALCKMPTARTPRPGPAPLARGSSAYNIESRLQPNDLIILMNQGEDHGGQIEHQECAREPGRRACECGEPIQFRIAQFESNSESRTTSYSN